VKDDAFKMRGAAVVLKIALDRSALRAFLKPVAQERAWESTVELQQSGATLHVLPCIAAEMDADTAAWRELWRAARVEEIAGDEFLQGCATGLAQRYLDYHSDPRDCRVAAEAECAQLDLVLTLNEEFVSGLGTRVEKVRIDTPSNAARQLRRTDVMPETP
jgi:hypothetical protein